MSLRFLPLLLVLGLSLAAEAFEEGEEGHVSAQLGDYETRIAIADDGTSKFYLENDPRIKNYNYLSYAHDVIFDPCRNREPNCCFDKYGVPEYIRIPRPEPMGWVWAIDAERMPHKCQKPCSGEFQAVVESNEVYDWKFDFMDSDEEFVWAINNIGGALFKRVLDGTSPWEFINKGFAFVSASGARYVWGVETETRDLKRCLKPCTGQWTTYNPEQDSYPWDAGDRILSVDSDKTHVYLTLESGRAFVRRLFLAPGSTYEFPNQDPDVELMWTDVLDYKWVPLLSDDAVEQFRLKKLKVHGGVNCSKATSRDETKDPFELHYVSASSVQGSLWAVDVCKNLWSCVSPCLNGNDWQLAWKAASPEKGVERIDADQVDVWATIQSDHGEHHELRAFPAKAYDEAKDIPMRPLTFGGSLEATGGKVVYVTASSNPEYTSIFSAYTVEKDPGICATFSDDEETCNDQVDFGCRYHVDGNTCEKLIPPSRSRLQDEETLFGDSTCLDLDMLNTDTGIYERTTGFSLVKETNSRDIVVKRDPECRDDGVRQKYRQSLRPACWDYNTTIEAHTPCYTTEGEKENSCVTLGISSTNYIVQCGGAFANDPLCGTFLEIHLPDDDEILGDKRITEEFTSGYRTMTLSLNYKGMKDRVVCRGQYELWWVQRTRYARIVEMKKRFFLTFPTCDWHGGEMRYYPYAVIWI